LWNTESAIGKPHNYRRIGPDRVIIETGTVLTVFALVSVVRTVVVVLQLCGMVNTTVGGIVQSSTVYITTACILIVTGVGPSPCPQKAKPARIGGRAGTATSLRGHILGE